MIHGILNRYIQKTHYNAVEFFSFLFNLFDFAKTNISKLQGKKIPHEKILRTTVYKRYQILIMLFFWL